MPKKPFVLFIIIVCLLWLAGCEQAAPEILPTATAVPSQPTATATTPPTALPSATMGVETGGVAGEHPWYIILSVLREGADASYVRSK